MARHPVELAALIVGTLALVLVFYVERLRRPKLDIVPSRFQSSGPVPWTFAAVQVHNRPLRRPLRWFFTRNIAQGCAVRVDFEEWDRDVRVIGDIPARWSSNPQPIRPMPGTIAPPSPGPTGPTGRPTTASAALPASTSYAYDPTLDPRRHDVAVSPEGEEVAVAILHPDPMSPDAGAYAFGTESYNYPSWRRPEWKLDQDTYRVRVTVTGSDVECRKSFKLEYLDDDFARFVLVSA